MRDVVEVSEDGEIALPDPARQTLLLMAATIEGLSARIRDIEIELLAFVRPGAAGRRLETIAGIDQKPWEPRERA